MIIPEKITCPECYLEVETVGHGAAAKLVDHDYLSIWRPDPPEKCPWSGALALPILIKRAEREVTYQSRRAAKKLEELQRAKIAHDDAKQQEAKASEILAQLESIRESSDR